MGYVSNAASGLTASLMVQLNSLTGSGVQFERLSGDLYEDRNFWPPFNFVNVSPTGLRSTFLIQNWALTGPLPILKAQKDSDDSDSGMSGGKKVGIAFGVVSGACLVGLAAKVYKKRQENIRRAQFGYYGNDDML
nr:cyclin-dependent kinase inhibitor 1C-like [Ipomoea trifida]